MSDEEGTEEVRRFPDKILSNILTRLPAKTLHRFKLVSKHFHSLLTSPPFLSSYLSLHSPTWALLDRVIHVTPPSTLHSPPSTSPHSTSLSLLPPPRVSSLHLSSPDAALSPSSRVFPVLISSSHSLLLLAATSTKTRKFPEQDFLLVLNPTTHQLSRIPPHRPLFNRPEVGFTTILDEAGLVEKFILVEYRPVSSTRRANIMHYGSDTGTWVEMPANYMIAPHLWRCEGAFEFEGSFFWFDLYVGMIVWVDFGAKLGKTKAELELVPLPRECVRTGDVPGVGDRRWIGVTAGWLQFVDVVGEGEIGGGQFVFNFWRLKDYRTEEWCFMYKVDYFCGLGNFRGVDIPNPMFFHPFEPEIVFFVVDDRIYFVNARTRKVYACGCYSNSVLDHLFLTAFVIPAWPSPLPKLNAASAKDRGNEYFKEKNYGEAVKCYTRSISCSPTSALYANRAAAFLNLKRYVEAEKDCTEALKLDEHNTKAYWRRVVARKELGKLRSALKDAECALKLDPRQHEMQKLYAEIKTSLEKMKL